MKDNEHIGHRERVRNRVRTEGLDNFYNYQVLEYMLSFVIPYKDTNPIAHNLIKRFGSISGVFEADVDELKKIKGMGEVSANFVGSFLKIYNYYAKEKINDTLYLNSPKQTYDYAKSLYKGTTQNEEVFLILLTPKGKIIKTEKLATGTLTEASITIRQITNSLVKNNAHNIIIVHNHPKGNTKPSESDNNFTKVLVTTLIINDCNILDHIIVSGDKYFSYRASGDIDKYKNEIKDMVNTKLKQPEAPYNIGSKYD